MGDTDIKTGEGFELTPQEELNRHNLETRKFWATKRAESVIGENTVVDAAGSGLVPEQWNMLKEIKLYPWQKQGISDWFIHKKGTIKVVTGAGKTVLALGIIEKLHQINKELRVAIVVPTVVLLNQWYEEILKISNLPEQAIGRFGGGYNDDFSNKRVLIAVLNSASAKLAGLVNAEIADNLLLVVDECHRAGAAEMRKVFQVKRAYNLGLSATPEREDFFENEDALSNDELDYDKSLLGQELGPIVIEMSLKTAYEMGILPKFEVKHMGLLLTKSEREKYDALSRSIHDLSRELKERLSAKRPFNDKGLLKWCQNMAKKDGPLSRIAKDFIYKTSDRKRLLYQAETRNEVVVKLLLQEYLINPSVRAILFNETIEGVMRLYQRLLSKGLPVVAEHSGLSQNIRENSIELFRQGTAQIIVSARSLIEGFNVPSADLAIIVASNTSVRQRIQTLGRVLRKSAQADVEKEAVVYVLYMHQTTDEVIYGKTDWNDLIGAERNSYFLWEDLDQEPKEQEGPPRTSLVKEKDILPQDLKAGGEYLGEYRGSEYTCDSAGNVFDAAGKPVTNPQYIPDKIKQFKGGYGRFRVTPLNRFVLVQTKSDDEWETIYVGTLKEPFVVNQEEEPGEPSQVQAFDSTQSNLGDEFPGALLDGREEIFYFKQRQGRLFVARRTARGDVYAKEGGDTLLLLGKLQDLRNQGTNINKFMITRDRHAVYLNQGTYRYIMTLSEGLKFPF